MKLSYLEIPTAEDLSLERREMRWDDKKFVEFHEGYVNRVDQYLIENGFDDKIAERIEYFPVQFLGHADTIDDEKKLEYSIQTHRRELAYDLCYLMFLIVSGPVNRLRISKGALKYQKVLLSAYLARVEIVLEDASFVKYMGFNLDELLAKHESLKRNIEEIKHKRAGQSKIYATAMGSLISKLDDYGYDTDYQRTDFLYNLFVTFKLPGFRVNNKEEAIDTVRKWIPLSFPS